MCRTTRDKDAKVTEKAAYKLLFNRLGMHIHFDVRFYSKLIFLSRGCADDSWRALVGTSEEERLMGVDEDLMDDWREKNRYQTSMG